MKVASKFKKDQRIFCSGGSHQGETAVILKVNNQRLRVKFDNPKHDGMFVDVADAIIISQDFDVIKDPDPRIKSVPTFTPKYGYYAVAKGRNVGVYHTWEECEEEVKGFKNAKFRKFKNLNDALNFVHVYSEQKPAIKDNNAFKMPDQKKIELSTLLNQLAITTAIAIKEACKDKNNVQETHECFYNEVKKYLAQHD